LVSDRDDLSGQMVFIHWSGRQGLAEDSGIGTFDTYRLLSANPTPTSDSPTPARLRVTYENDVLKVGGCYGCETPAVGLPKTLNFEPKQVYIVASSHTTSAIQAHLAVRDAYAEGSGFQQVSSSTLNCTQGQGSLSIPLAGLENLERLYLEAYRDNTLVASTSAVKTFSAQASCEVRDDLLAPKLRRLSELQIQNSIIDVFGDRFSPDIWPDMEDGAKLIGMNSTADKLNINNLNYERFLATAQAVTRTVLTSEPTLAACAISTSSDCVLAIVTDYGKRLWRRPLTTTELNEFSRTLTTLSDNTQRLTFAVNSLLLSADFLFRSELGKLQSNTQVLNNYEMVSVLSYAVVNSTPDDTLLALAAQSEPLTSSQLQTQIDRLFASANANRAMMDVYKDYLKLDLVLSRPKDASFNFTDSVRRDVLTSAEQILIDKIATNPRYIDVFLGNDYYLNSTIDDLFNQEVNHSGLQKVTLNSRERQGILSHPAFLSVHSTLTNSGIVKRGVFALEQLLCQELPDPPGDVMPVPAPEGVDPALTSERDLLQITHSAQTACIACHQVIDPAGFGFENFDAIGRYRTVEKGSVAIDASGILDNVGEQTLVYANSAEYAEALVTSPQMNTCVSRRFLESFLGQDLELSACELDKYKGILASSDGSVKSLLNALIQLESFGKRSL
jgi:hypothetical protein